MSSHLQSRSSDVRPDLNRRFERETTTSQCLRPRSIKRLDPTLQTCARGRARAPMGRRRTSARHVQDARQEAEEHLKRIDDAYNKRRKELEESLGGGE